MDIQPISIEKSLEDFQEFTKKPEIFLNSESALNNSVKNHLKEFYDFSKIQEKKFTGSKGLSKLLIQNFDIEQIWQEIELQNNSILSKSLNDVTRLVVNKKKLIFDNLADDKDTTENNKDESEIDDFEDEQEELDKKDEDEDDEEEDEMDVDNSEEDEIDEKEKESIDKFSKKKSSVVDDEFFKLEEMENFLNVEDKKELNQNTTKNIDESDSDEEESIDLFEEDVEENLEEESDKSRTAKFKDFFRSSEPQRNDQPKRNKFLEEMSEEENDNEPKSKSSLELRQERLQQKIEEIEDNAISEKPWALKGEILAENRPQNSLLEEILEFDLTARPAPVITETSTLQLEDIIKQRIKDKVFDSVVRKEKPIETPLQFKKKLTLDQEKSKHSLAQIYEKEYVNEQAALDPANADKEEEEPAIHKEIKTMMRDLFNKLDALSNFHFTPKPALPELRVVNNLPAIVMEEVAPVTANEASLLAPEEIRNKSKGDILGDSERTKTDKNRQRRIKKLKQKKHKQLINKNMLTKGTTQGTTKMSDVLKNRNTHKMEESNAKRIKSSKAFFTQLQEQAQAQIGKKLQNSGKKKEKSKINARKLKL